MEGEAANISNNFIENINGKYNLTEEEICSEIADCILLGNDLFCFRTHQTNKEAIRWLAREFTPLGIRVHHMNILFDQIPSHIDACLVPVREGLFINSIDRPVDNKTRNFFNKNDWKILDIP